MIATNQRYIDSTTLSLNSIMEKFKIAEEVVPSKSDLDVEAFSRGMKPESLNLYQGHSACSCCINWIEEFPDDLKESIEAAEGTQKYALLLRNRKSHKKNSTQPLELDSIVVHSPLIKKILDEKVFKGYPGITSMLDKLEFSAPFAPFLHRWVEFKRAFEDEQDDAAKQHLKLMCDNNNFDLLGTASADTTQLRCNLPRHPKRIRDGRRHAVERCHYSQVGQKKPIIPQYPAYGHSLLWAIFKPGDMLYVPEAESLYQLKPDGLEYDQEDKFNLNLEFVSWNGEHLGYDSTSTKIPKVSGTRKIRDLPIYPIALDGNQDDIRLTCRNRGEKFVALRGAHAKVLSQSVGKDVNVPGISTIRPPVS
jgi:hypothetical protein